MKKTKYQILETLVFLSVLDFCDQRGDSCDNEKKDNDYISNITWLK